MKTLHLILNHSRSFGGHEDQTSQHDLEVWKKIADQYSDFDLTDSTGRRMQFSVDWRPRVAYEERLRDLYNASSAPLAKGIGTFDFEHVHVCPVMIATSDQSSASTDDHLILRVLHEIFLVANLASPGSFNLYRSYLRDPALDPEKDPLAQTELELSEYLFEIAWHCGRDTPWLKVDFLPFDQVFSWYESVDMRSRSSASAPVERTLLCLLHLSKASFMEQGSTLWIASALESLFDTPSGSSFSLRCARIASFLNLNAPDAGELRRALRSFFNARHAFIHGGSEVLHPVLDERDKKLDKAVTDLLRLNDFACSIIVGCIQELIRRGWRGMRFEEQV